MTSAGMIECVVRMSLLESGIPGSFDCETVNGVDFVV